jgi:hypothetical protein
LSIKLTSTQKLILFMLAARIGQNEKTWIKQYELAKDCGINTRNFRLNIKQLIGHKLIICEKIITKKGKQDNYKINEQIISNYRSRETGSEIDGLPVAGDRTPRGTTGRRRPDPTGRRRPVVVVEKVSQVIENNNETPKNALNHITYESNNKKKKQIKQTRILLPDWLPKDLWKKFLANRKYMKSSMSPIAKKLLITKLTNFREEGLDISDLLKEAIERGWKSVFRPKQKFNGEIVHQKTSGSDELQEYWERLNGRDAERTI